MSIESEQLRLRQTFGEVAEGYARARPTYPPEVFDDLAALASLPQGARVVEVGCGTGQATLPLAERGYLVTCIELSEALAAVARRQVSRFDNVEVVAASFETWEPVEADFDAVVAFTSWHWLTPERRYRRAAFVLRPDGLLAVVATKHVLPDDGDEFFAAVQEDYLAETDETDTSPPPHPDRVPDLSDEIERSGLFENVGVRRYVWDVTYEADDYLALLDTYSGHRALDPSMRARLYERIRRRIERRPGRIVRKTYLATLNVARRRPAA